MLDMNKKLAVFCMRTKHAEETKLAAIEYSDIRLATKMNELCSEEKAVYCKVCAFKDLLWTSRHNKHWALHRQGVGLPEDIIF
jgi:hypothetical protein